jgi:hypothetical protein
MRSFIAPLINTWGSIPRLVAQVHFSGLKNLAVHFSGLELVARTSVAGGVGLQSRVVLDGAKKIEVPLGIRIGFQPSQLFA